MSPMFITKKVCKECGSRLHRTNLEGKLFCKKCYEYKKLVEEDVSLFGNWLMLFINFVKRK